MIWLMMEFGVDSKEYQEDVEDDPDDEDMESVKLDNEM